MREIVAAPAMYDVLASFREIHKVVLGLAGSLDDDNSVGSRKATAHP
jgi:hypothetical protein